MAKMIKSWSDEAWEDFESWIAQDKKTFKKILKLINSIDRHGYNGIGHPEPLKHELSGYWSVEIDEKNRIVFRIKNNAIEFIQCGSHYRDK
jgi:toxin YoeB